MTVARPTLPERPCPVCGATVEPLRAREVVLMEDGFRFLCDADCRVRFAEGERHEEASREGRNQARPPKPKPRAEPRRRSRRPSSTSEVTAAYRALAAPPAPPPWFGLGASAVALLLAFFADHPLIALLSALVVAIASAAALHRGWASRAAVGWLGWGLSPVGATMAAVAAVVEMPSRGELHWWMVGAASAAGCVVLRAWLDARAYRPLDEVVATLRDRVPVEARVPINASEISLEVESDTVQTARVRAGQETLVSEGETVAVDGVVQAGEATVLLHPSTRAPVRRRAGEPIVAGAFVVEGQLRILATRVGEERALLRPTLFGASSPGSRAAKVTMLAGRLGRWGGLAALLVAAGTLAWGASDGVGAALVSAAAVLLAVPLATVRRASEAPWIAAGASAAERGITFASARAMDRAGRASVVALCTHGTVTEGEPEVIEISSVGDADGHGLIALVAGAESIAEGHPIATAVARFCARRGIEPAPMRRARFIDGRGVTAIAPGGQELVVGNRGLLLEVGVSVAIADADATRSEDRGYTVVFVGLDGRVRAVMSLRDEERLGARAAVQRLIDLGVEVVLLSGDHRGTVEALARTLDITHVRAELSPEDRGAEVTRLRETGSVVAVVGRPGHDERALAGAEVAVVLGAAGGGEDHEVALTGDDVRDAAAALWIARAARRTARRGTTVSTVGGLALVTAAASGLAGPGIVALTMLALDSYVLPGAARLLRRIELRLPARG